MGLHTVCTVLLLLVSHLCSGNIYHPNLVDDENIVNSDGMWHTETEPLKPASKTTQGASRFDVGGILSAFGVKQTGASMFAMIVFPLLFPLMILLGIALFVMSVFGTGGVAVAGRRSGHILTNSGGGATGYTPAGYKVDHDGFPISLTNRDGLAFDVLGDSEDSCVERFVCEILVHGGGSVIGKQATLQLLKGLNVMPIILPNSSPGRKSRKLWNCSSLKCNWEKWNPWQENTVLNGET